MNYNIKDSYTLPPSNCAFKVTTNAPTQIRTNIMANTSDLPEALALNVL
jgi:hypothetical protein